MKEPKRRKIFFPIVEVKWDDILSKSAWQPTRRGETVECFTTGYLTYKDKDAITICGSFNGMADYSDKTTIPRGVIKRIRHIGRASIHMFISEKVDPS